MTESDAVATHLRRLQIVVLAIAAGASAFALVAYFLRRSGSLEVDVASAATGPLLLALALFGLTLVAVFPFIRRSAVERLAKLRRQSGHQGTGLAEPPLLAAFTTLTIVRAALVESFSLAAVVVFLLTGSLVAFGAGIGGVLALASAAPTRQRLEELANTAAGAPGP
jgi:hypothetical protein